MSVWSQGRKSTVKQPRTSRRNSRRETSQPLRRSTATWLALLIPTTFNSCSTQSQTSLSPIISVAAVSIRINIAVVEPIDRHTLTLTCINTTDMYCENGGARENERLRDCQVARLREKDRVTEGERTAERTGTRKRDTPMYHRYYYRPPADTFSTFFIRHLFVPALSTFLLIILSDSNAVAQHNVYATLCIMCC